MKGKPAMIQPGKKPEPISDARPGIGKVLGLTLLAGLCACESVSITTSNAPNNRIVLGPSSGSSMPCDNPPCEILAPPPKPEPKSPVLDAPYRFRGNERHYYFTTDGLGRDLYCVGPSWPVRRIAKKVEAGPLEKQHLETVCCKEISARGGVVKYAYSPALRADPGGLRFFVPWGRTPLIDPSVK
jgi:hypothetical protein